MPIREYECVQCGNRNEVLELAGQIAEGFAMSEVNHCPCECGNNEWDEIFTRVSFRLMGEGFRVNDHGRPKKFAYSTDKRTKMRQEIRDAHDHGEIPPGVNCFDTDAHKRKPPSGKMDDFYGHGSSS